MNIFVCRCGAHGDFDRLRLVGIQRVPAGEDGPAEVAVLRNCPSCRTTICLAVDEAEAQRVEREGR